jgi:predicted Zn-dependent protease
VFRFAYFVLLAASVSVFAQDSAQKQGQQVPPVPAATEPQTVSEQVLDAEAAIVKSDWKTAEDKLNSWLTTHAADARALFDAGYVADVQNRLDDAVSLYERAVAANPKSFEARVSLGLLLARQGRQDDARPELAVATTLDPGQAGPETKARAWRALAQIDRDANPTEASNDLLEALKLSPETADDTLLAAGLADQTGQYAAAETAYRRYLAGDPKSASANAGLAHTLIARKQYPAAETFLRSALEQDPDDPTLTAQLATVLAAQDKAEALPLIQKLHDAHPADPAITLMLAELMAEAGDAAGSDQLYLTLLAATPDDADLQIAHGQNLIHLFKYADAFTAFNKATEVSPSNADGWSGLAFAASRTNQPAIVLHALTMRSRYLPEVPSTYFLWATAYDTLHQTAEAASYYHRFLDSAAGKMPDQEWQAKQRLKVLEKR